MKYIVFMLGIVLFMSCDYNKPRYICVCANLVDNYPKGAKIMDYPRVITYILKFRNGSKDSIFFPFFNIYGWGKTRSAFYVRRKGYTTMCEAKFWGYQNNTHVVAPGESARIGIYLRKQQLEELHIVMDADIEDIEKEIEVFYKYDSEDKEQNCLKTPKIEVKNYGTVFLLYGKRYSTD